MKWRHVLPPVLLAVMSFAVVAQGEEVPPASPELTFSSQFRTAVLGQNTRQIIRLTHPHSQECIAEDERDYYYGMVLKGLVRVLGEQQTIEDVRVLKVDPEKLQHDAAAVQAGTIRWPVPPEEQIIIRYTKDGLENTASLYIARDRDKWKWVHACAQ